MERKKIIVFLTEILVATMDNAADTKFTALNSGHMQKLFKTHVQFVILLCAFARECDCVNNAWSGYNIKFSVVLFNSETDKFLSNVIQLLSQLCAVSNTPYLTCKIRLVCGYYQGYTVLITKQLRNAVTCLQCLIDGITH